MRLIFLSISLLFSLPFSTVAAQTGLASCFHVASDQDGDGFGYENSVSCIVDETTRGITEPNDCVDYNADGYGWNGIETCSVEIIPNPDCDDTAPFGDGWGWNGEESCRVIPLLEVREREVEILKSKLLNLGNGVRPNKMVIMFCPPTNESFYLGIEGQVEYWQGAELISSGLWSTGMYDRNGTIWLYINGEKHAVSSIDTDSLKYRGVSCVFF